ncbi:MAG TPA: LPXTG cell wall anchor domain-containing protein [Candidatus Bilamarchaeum sp.]|nr:LPXTG cell wall anchor domain-containing protein [Candidatus Bilamarchaeum sp.]
MLKQLALVFILLCLAHAQDSSVSYPEQKFAGNLDVMKYAPLSVNLTEEFPVTITLRNNGSSEVRVTVNEYLGNVEPVDPLPNYTDVIGDSLAAQPPRLSWELSLGPGESQSLVYRVKPKTVGILSFGPTEVLFPGGKAFSNSLEVAVECSSAPGCDERIGETPLTCPDKCGLGPNSTAPVPPEQKPIPTPYLSQAPKAPAQEDNLLLYAGVVLLALLAIYLIFRRKN